MASVGVSRAAIQQADRICSTAIQELHIASQKLNTRYRDAGQKWKDDKYKQLGVIIEDCSRAIKSPIDELSDCITKLRQLDKTIQEYENTNL